MTTIYEQSDPTWSRDITEETAESPRRNSKFLFPASVVFALSAAVAGAAESPAPVALDAACSSARYYVEERPGPFSALHLNRTWAATVRLIRDLGADPDELLQRASETLDKWRLQPDRDDYSDGIDLDEDQLEE